MYIICRLIAGLSFVWLPTLGLADVLYQGGSTATYNNNSTLTTIDPNAPRIGSADMTLVGYCTSSATRCLVANSAKSELSLFRRVDDRFVGVMSWDVVMRDPGRVLRGFVTMIDFDPDWYPPTSVRRDYAERGIELPSYVPPGDPLNAMGDVKIIMSGDFAGTAIRIHDTPGFSDDWVNADSAGCVRVLDLKTTVVPLIQGEITRVVFM